MKIWFDISHIAQFNFYLESIIILSDSNEVVVTVLDRGNLYLIARKELENVKCKIIVLGKHKGNKFSVIFDANIIRLLKLYQFCYKFKPEISVGNGFLHGIVSNIFKFPNIMFNDDLERKINVGLMIYFSTEIYHITGVNKNNSHKKIKIFNALKEWAYLSPKYFTPNDNVLSEYNLQKNKYIFVREVITGTLNYSSQKSNLIESITDKFPKGVNVILSLEDKSRKEFYPKNWLLLDEPIEDIHSLMYYSCVVVSSGDSMAREGAVLGIPSIYCGNREMLANEIMVSKGKLFSVSIEKAPKILSKLIINKEYVNKDQFREDLNIDWIDVTEFIISRIYKYKKKQ